MYIYLDESFSLKKGEKNQFLIIAGFATQNPKAIAKIYKRIKRHTLPKKFINLEIKSTNPIADRALKPKLFSELNKTDIQIYAISQLKNQLPKEYFDKEKLLYEKLYLDLLNYLLVNEWNYFDNKIVIVTLDTFKPKQLKRGDIINLLKKELKNKYPEKNFLISFESSAKFLTLQLADQICGVFYQLLQENQTWFKMIEPKLKKIVTNPLSPYKKE
jgi:hypothetical protein